MIKQLILGTATLLIGVSAYAVGNLNPMTQDQLTQLIQDKTLTTIPLSTIDNHLVADRISIYFGKDGEAQGHLAKKDSKLPQNDTGKWEVKEDGALCISWKSWFKSKAFCDYAYDAKNSIIFLNGEGAFVSLVLKSRISSGKHH